MNDFEKNLRIIIFINLLVNTDKNFLELRHLQESIKLWHCIVATLSTCL